MSDLSKNAKTEQRNKRAAEKAAAEVAQEIEEAVRKERRGLVLIRGSIILIPKR